MNKFWQFRSAQNDPKTGELLLYGVIESTSWWGDEVTPKQFQKDLVALGDISVLNVYINSEGGDVFASQAIYSMLKRHKAKVNTYIDGLAASGASVVAMAGDTVRMPRNAMVMVHNAWTIAMGNAADFRKLADDLDQIGETLVAVYQEKTGLERGKIVELLDAETWLTADEALAYGFIDEIEGEKEIAASLSGGTLTLNGLTMDISRYKNRPKLAFLPEKRPQEPPEKPPVAQKQANDLLFLLQKSVEVKRKKFKEV